MKTIEQEDSVIDAVVEDLVDHGWDIQQVKYTDKQRSRPMRRAPIEWPSTYGYRWQYIDVIARKGTRWRFIEAKGVLAKSGRTKPNSQLRKELAVAVFQALRTRNAFRDPGRYLVEIAVPDLSVFRRILCEHVGDSYEDANGIPSTLDIYLWEKVQVGWIWVPTDPSEPLEYVFNDPNDEE